MARSLLDYHRAGRSFPRTHTRLPYSKEPKRRRIRAAIFPAAATYSTSGLDIRAYTSAGVRKYLPTDCVRSISWELTERGGYGSANMELLATWTDAGLDIGDRVDVRLFGSFAYRGFVWTEQKDLRVDEGETPILYGLIEKLNGYQVRRKYVYGSPVDIGTVFSDIISDYVAISGRLPSIVVDAQTIGATIQTFDAVGMSVAEAFNALCDLSLQTAIWGHDVNGSFSDRLYLRPRASTVAKKYVVGGSVEAFVYPQDATQIVNTVYIRGGKASQPNLATNGSFEEPLPNSETIGNLLANYSWENGSASWSLSGGASVKSTGGGPTAVGAPRSGSSWLELDNNGERATQTVAIDYRVLLTASIYARYEHAVDSAGRTVTVEVEGLDAGSSVVTTVTIASAADPYGVQYVQYTGTVDFSAYSTVTQARFVVRAHGGSASNDGIICDDAALFEKSGVSSSGWEYALAGSATRARLDWINRDVTPYHGALCVLAQAAGVGGASDYLIIRTADNARVPVRPGQAYTVAFFVRGDGTNNVSFSIAVEEFNGSGTSLGVTESSTTTDNYSTFTLKELSFTAAASAQSVELIIRVRNNNLHYIDAAAIVEGALPVDWYGGGYWAGDTYERKIATTDLPPSVPGRAPAGLSSGASNSITNYGVREAVIDNDQITDQSSAYLFCYAYFNTRAVPTVQGQLTIFGPDALLELTGTVKLVNLSSAPSALFPSVVRYTVGGGDDSIRIQADLGNEAPDLATTLRFVEAAAQRARR